MDWSNDLNKWIENWRRSQKNIYSDEENMNFNNVKNQNF